MLPSSVLEERLRDGHLAFMTHRCWKISMRKAIYLAAEAWRREYSQLDTKKHTPDSSVTYTLPGSDDAVIIHARVVTGTTR